MRKYVLVNKAVSERLVLGDKVLETAGPPVELTDDEVTAATQSGAHLEPAKEE